MQGIIFQVRRFSVQDGPGIRTTVFFKGCPLKCPWCHNPEGIQPEIETIQSVQKVYGQEIPVTETIGYPITVESLMNELMADRMFYQESGGGVTFSGGEPLLQFDFLLELLQRCRKAHLHTCLDTSGYGAFGQIESLIPWVNLFLFDLKFADPQKHLQCIGVPLEKILNHLSILHEKSAEVIIRIPLIPGINDDEIQMQQVTEILEPLKRFRRIDLLPYHRLGMSKYRKLKRNLDFTANDTHSLKRAQEVRNWLVQKGYRVIIGG